jgi:hypothetical protein
MNDIGGSLEKSADKLAGSLYDAVSQVMTANAAPPSQSTSSKATAIAVIQKDELLSDDEMLKACNFIRKYPDDAEIIVAIEKPLLRVRYLRGRLEELQE